MANKPSFVTEQQATTAREHAAIAAKTIRENEEIPTLDIETFAATHPALEGLFERFEPFETIEDDEQVVEWLATLLADELS